MTRLALGFAILVFAASVAGCTGGTAGSTAQSACFFPSDITNWKSEDAVTFLVRTQRGQVFRGRLATVCPEIDWSRQMAVQPAFGARRVCDHTEASLLVREADGELTYCRVREFNLLSEDEASALGPNLGR